MNDQQQPAEENPGRGKTGRGKNGRFIRSLDTATKDALAAQLRARSVSYREIAAKLGYEGESGAHKAVQRALAAVPVEAVEELRALECARLDALAQRLWSILDTRYPLITPGVDLVDQNGQPVPDPGPILAVADRLLRITAQRTRLLGLEQQQKPEAPDTKPASLELVERLLAALLQGAERQAIDAAPVRALPTWDSAQPAHEGRRAR